jgi:hypothetical protein
VKAFYFLFILSVTVSCNTDNDGEVQFEQPTKLFLTSVVNNKARPAEQNLAQDIYLENAGYPLEIALYNDNSFYYNLPALGDGHGKWEEIKSGYQLISRRKLGGAQIEMKYIIRQKNDSSQNLEVRFEDRKGLKILPLRLVNAP